MKQRMHLLFVVFVLGLVGITTLAQTPTGSIEGVITDPGKAVVSGATVTVTATATGQSFTATTNEEGFFTFRSLSPFSDFNFKISLVISSVFLLLKI